MAMKSYKALNVLIAPDLKAALDKASELSGMSRTQIIEAMIANAAGQTTWKGAGAVKRAWAAYRRQGWWRTRKETAS